MHARINNPAVTIPGALEALRGLSDAVQQSGLSETTVALVELRASQINGCSICVDMHTRELKNLGEPEHRINLVVAWRETPYFSDPERAALALAEAATRLADSPQGISDGVWDEAARHYDERQLAALVLAIAEINTWNRINAVTRQVTGEWVNGWIRHAAKTV